MKRSKLTVLLFFGALWASLIGMFRGWGQFDSSDENRPMTSWAGRGTPLAGYIQDHFGFRGTLITAQALFKVKLLHVSSSPEVVLGKDGWLFYSGEKSMESYRGEFPFTGPELERWVQAFRSRRERLAASAIGMLVVIVPDKQTVYPELLPASFPPRSRASRRVALAEALQRAHVPVLDLLPSLAQAKQFRRVYSPADTHWNAWGVYQGYREIAQALSGTGLSCDLQPLAVSAHLVAVRPAAGDLAKMLGLGKIWRETGEEPEPPGPFAAKAQANGVVLIENPAACNRELILSGDSFALPLAPYLAQHFKQVLVIRNAAAQVSDYLRDHPAAVVFELVERKLNAPPVAF